MANGRAIIKIYISFIQQPHLGSKIMGVVSRDQQFDIRLLRPQLAKSADDHICGFCLRGHAKRTNSNSTVGAWNPTSHGQRKNRQKQLMDLSFVELDKILPNNLGRSLRIYNNSINANIIKQGFWPID